MSYLYKNSLFSRLRIVRFIKTVNLHLWFHDRLALVAGVMAFAVVGMSLVAVNRVADAVSSAVPGTGTATSGDASIGDNGELSSRKYASLASSVATGTNYYVSKKGSNGDGKSWAAAWNELNKVNWPVIAPGDTINIDGGSTYMVYRTALSVGKSGTAEAPITIRLSTESGRNGQARFFGGRTTQLPYCSQTGYTYQTTGVLGTIVTINNVSNVTIDGSKWNGIKIYGGNKYGIDIAAAPRNVKIRNVEINDMGLASQTANGTWKTDYPGIRPTGHGHVIDRVNLYNNGQDGIQSGGPLTDFTLSRSWLHNTRQNPLQPSGSAYNTPCVHQDGMQVYNGGTQANYFFEDTVFGPGLMQGLILGQALNVAGGNNAKVDNVTIRNSLFINGHNNIMGYPAVASQNWTIQNTTSYVSSTTASGSNPGQIFLDGTGHVVQSSILYGGNIHLPANSTGSNNCQFGTRGNVSYVPGQTIDPKFVTNVGAYKPTASLQTLERTNFALTADSPCAGKGSSVTSPAKLIELNSL